MVLAIQGRHHVLFCKFLWPAHYLPYLSYLQKRRTSNLLNQQGSHHNWEAFPCPSILLQLQILLFCLKCQKLHTKKEGSQAMNTLSCRVASSTHQFTIELKPNLSNDTNNSLWVQTRLCPNNLSRTLVLWRRNNFFVIQLWTYSIFGLSRIYFICEGISLKS